jgi:hypothetical protein
VIGPAFERFSRYITGHSDPFEQSNVQRTVVDLEADWTLLNDCRKAYIAD